MVASLNPRAIASRVMSMPVSGRSSGAMAFAKKHKKPMMMGAGAIGVGRATIGGRRSGLDKTPGRPTGMYNY
jgi:hypothetical protein